MERTMSEEAEYGLVMPFVLTDDHGGPYDRHAFVSGYRLGQLDVQLSLAKAMPLVEPQEFVAHPIEQQQIDLIAMRHGYTLHAHPYDEYWWLYRFEPQEDPDDA